MKIHNLEEFLTEYRTKINPNKNINDFELEVMVTTRTGKETIYKVNQYGFNNAAGKLTFTVHK
jgi:hypothetical protein